MTDQSQYNADSGETTVPLVPDGGYTQPAVPPLEDTEWPDFSYDDPAGDAMFGAEPTIAADYSGPADARAATTPLPYVPAPTPYQNPSPTRPAASVPQPTTPLPYLTPEPGTSPLPPAAASPNPYSATPYPATPYAATPYPATPYAATPYQARPAQELPRYETYQPYADYATPAPVPYAYPAPTGAPDHPNAVTSLVLGICGIFVLPILAPFAWFLGSRGRREVARFPGRWASGGTLTAGYVLGIIGTVLWGLFAALLFLAFVLYAASF